jgi:hypothetical protein
MKRLFLISACLAAVSCYAQNDCNKDNPIYKFDNTNATPKEIRTLGSNPEFPFLRNMSSSHQVYMTIKKGDKTTGKGMTELNNMLMGIGYANGSRDLQESAVTETYIPSGTEGNMGSGGYGTTYARLMADNGRGTKAWKISSPSSATCSVYILAKCGNAFVPKETTPKTACLDVPISLTGDNKEITLNTNTSSVTDNTFIYYHRKKHRKIAGIVNKDIPDSNPSVPLLVNTKNRFDAGPQTFRVTVSTPDDHIKVCQDQTALVPANIDVERVSQYTGLYPKKNYKLVSKRVYNRTARKLRKAKRKEDKIAALTGLTIGKAS